jgi:hypothetical protein
MSRSARRATSANTRAAGAGRGAPRAAGSRPRWALASALALAPFAAAAPARAWEAASTHAGLTQRAVIASQLHRALGARFGRPLGLFEPLQLQPRHLSAGERRSLLARLEVLDPEGGFRPDAEGVNTALGWITAGAVLAKVPPERGRHHYHDPLTGLGLDDARGLLGVSHALRMAFDGVGGLRGLATGATFDGTGRSALDWISAPDNDLSLETLLRKLEEAVVAESPERREMALVRALLALGGVLCVLEDLGEPAHVRNDLRISHPVADGAAGAGSTGRGSRFEAYVAVRFGRTQVPPPLSPMRRPTLRAFFADADGEGLANRTQRRFFSEGTVPGAVPIDASVTPAEVARTARDSLAYPQPTVARLELRKGMARRYVVSEGRRVLAYERGVASVRFGLDDRVHADAAAALLPEIGAYAAGLVDSLLQVRVDLRREGGRLQIKLDGLEGSAEVTRVTVLAEDRRGARRALPVNDAGRVSVAGLGVEAPTGARRVAVAVAGSDRRGPFIAVGELGLE